MLPMLTGTTSNGKKELSEMSKGCYAPLFYMEIKGTKINEETLK